MSEEESVRRLLELIGAGRHEELLAAARQAEAAFPQNGKISHLHGVAHLLLNRHAEALEPLRRAAELIPGDAEVWDHLGLCLSYLGQWQEAAGCFEQSAVLNPHRAETWINAARNANEAGRFDLGEGYARRGLELRPGAADAGNTLGWALNGLGRYQEAAACLLPVVAAQPEHVAAWLNLGAAVHALGNLREAEVCYRRAVDLAPGFALAHLNLANLAKDMGDVASAETGYRRVLQLEPDNLGAMDNLLFLLHNNALSVPEEAAAGEARRYGDSVRRRAKPFTSWDCGPGAGRPLRVGLVSGDLRRHPVGYVLGGVLDKVDPERILWHAYSNAAAEDDLSERLKASCADWLRVAGWSDEDLARKVHGDRIDILIDLAGHTAHNRLPVFAWKPAPVQVAWLGYFATTGVDAVDYILADPTVLPPDEEHRFHERPWRLPDSYFCFSPPETALPVAALPALAEGHVTFGCFNNSTKLNDRVVALWARILCRLPGSRLMLKAGQFSDAGLCTDLAARFAGHGIAADRLVFEGKSAREEYFAAYGKVDIALDPFPFPGGMTSIDGLWMGVPVLTLKGDRFIGHQGETILASAGLQDWIAEDEADYAGKACAFAADLPALAELRRGLRPRLAGSPLFDTSRFALHLQQALEGMWRERPGAKEKRR